MGFKKTTEGRVFFSNIDESAAASRNERQSYDERSSLPDDRAAASAKALLGRQDTTQAQIVALLKALNHKLQDTQADRAALHKELKSYKKAVQELQEKADRQERESQLIKKQISESSNGAVKKVLDTQKLTQEAYAEFSEARKLILQIEERAERAETQIKRQQTQIKQSEEQIRVKYETLEQKQKKHAHDVLVKLTDQESRQKLLDSRVDEALNATQKIERKIEKAVQERARLIRKLERIEESVLQTNEALNARAMVLLTDQAAGGMTGSGAASASKANAAIGYDDANGEMNRNALPFWRKSKAMQAASVSAVVVIAALAGWGISEIQRPASLLSPSAVFTSVQRDAPSSSQQSAAQQTASWQAPFENIGDLGRANALDEESARAFDSLIDEYNAVPQQQEIDDSAAIAAPAEFGLPATDPASNDIGAIDLNDEQQILALLENNPDALAAQLNALEPSTPAPEPNIEQPAAVAPAPATTTSATTTTIQPSTAARENLTASLASVALPSRLSGTLDQRIRPDGNLPAAIKEVENSAFEGNGNAQHDLAAIYTAGHAGVRQDYRRAAQWFEEAAHQGVANARYNLGVLHHQGIGVTKNIETAFEWYKTAAALGHPEAQYNLGIAYIEGLGVPYDPIKAGAFFENAAHAGVTEAAYNLGLIYENGLYGRPQPDIALMWYKKAADQGSPEARAALEQLAKTVNMSISEVNAMIEALEKQGGTAQTQITAQKKTEELAGATPSVTAPTSPSAAAQSTNTAYYNDAGAGNLVMRVQETLMGIGLYPGPADGVGGAMTRDAVRSYQSRFNLPVTGEITPDLVAHMNGRATSEEGQFGEQGSRP
ncbi:MAG: peptidoglycan-binding protein [Alphaproteobacteria bacterium]